jgi:hypothetical protein
VSGPALNIRCNVGGAINVRIVAETRLPIMTRDFESFQTKLFPKVIMHDPPPPTDLSEENRRRYNKLGRDQSSRLRSPLSRAVEMVEWSATTI